jgi:hypothetical protein
VSGVSNSSHFPPPPRLPLSSACVLHLPLLPVITCPRWLGMRTALAYQPCLVQLRRRAVPPLPLVFGPRLVFRAMFRVTLQATLVLVKSSLISSTTLP